MKHDPIEGGKRAMNLPIRWVALLLCVVSCDAQPNPPPPTAPAPSAADASVPELRELSIPQKVGGLLQSDVEAVRLLCNPPASCNVTKDDYAAWKACAGEHVTNEKIRKEALGAIDKTSPDMRYSMLFKVIELTGADTDCPAADLVFDSMSRSEAVALFCKEGEKCFTPEIDEACVDAMFPENAWFRAMLREDLAKRIQEVDITVKQAYTIDRKEIPCPILERWEEERRAR